MGSEEDQLSLDNRATLIRGEYNIRYTMFIQYHATNKLIRDWSGRDAVAHDWISAASSSLIGQQID